MGEQMGEELLVRVYRLLSNDMNSPDSINKVKRMVGTHQMHLIHLVRQLLFCEEKLMSEQHNNE
eukprot:NODE_4544_length_650_cov_38.565724_g3890_i0.p2 GENE.NODE_4544_length_650_cov_38.565724_g3890_i0~~NODE_4544_length_650_cov_38.565724_g3890_i0.p2  ORF type:complete len:72 (+),score=38.80 NODE_4544_length_650_cov_38.565724_g3890_i0:25-216(+)